MTLITRVTRLFTADVNAVLDRIEEPEVVLKQAVREMAEELVRGEQRLRWMDAEGQQLERQIAEAGDALAALDEELDLCFEADEEQLARSLVRRKLTGEQQHKLLTRSLAELDRERQALSARVTEQTEQLADMRQKADLMAGTAANGFTPGPAESSISQEAISQEAIDVAYLREKQRRDDKRRQA